jgi:hypothetical protein
MVVEIQRSRIVVLPIQWSQRDRAEKTSLIDREGCISACVSSPKALKGSYLAKTHARKDRDTPEPSSAARIYALFPALKTSWKASVHPL